MLYLRQLLRNYLQAETRDYAIISATVALLAATLTIRNMSTNNTAKLYYLSEQRINHFALISIRSSPVESYNSSLNTFDRSDSIVPNCFLLAILAAENYNRPYWYRWIENNYSRLLITISGTLPDSLSLGIGQINVSNARPIVSEIAQLSQEETSDELVFEFLMDSSKNIEITHRYVDTIVENHEILDFNLLTSNKILQVYNGQYTFGPETDAYLQVVQEIYSILDIYGAQWNVDCSESS